MRIFFGWVQSALLLDDSRLDQVSSEVWILFLGNKLENRIFYIRTNVTQLLNGKFWGSIQEIATDHLSV